MVRSSSLPVAGRDDAFDHQKAAGGGDDLVDVLQDCRRLGVVPVVDDVAHQVGVGPRRDGLEEVAANHDNAVGDAGGPQLGLRPLDDAYLMRHIIHDWDDAKATYMA